VQALVLCNICVAGGAARGILYRMNARTGRHGSIMACGVAPQYMSAAKVVTRHDACTSVLTDTLGGGSQTAVIPALRISAARPTNIAYQGG
jgi:hypothetical protein